MTSAAAVFPRVSINCDMGEVSKEPISRGVLYVADTELGVCEMEAWSR